MSRHVVQLTAGGPVRLPGRSLSASDWLAVAQLAPGAIGAMPPSPLRWTQLAASAQSKAGLS